MSEDRNTTEAAIDAGAAIAKPTVIEHGGAFVVVPEGYEVKNMEKFLETPSRPRGTIVAETPEAFVAYYERFSTQEASMAFARSSDFRIEGVIDWHRPGQAAGFGEHRVRYEAPRSDEWTIWTGKNGPDNAMSQDQFALHIENNVKDIVEPAGADMLEVSRQLEVKKKVDFASATRLSDGQREFTYNEEVQGSTRRGQLKVPSEFKLGIPVFVGGEAYEVIARLRYRIASGQLALWYDLLNPHEIERDAFELIVDQIDKGVKTDVLMAALA